MQTPCEIRIPPLFSGNLQIKYEYPPGYEYKIPFAFPILISCELGDFLSQHINGDGYWIELWSFFIKQDSCYIDIEIKEPYIALTLFLHGNLEGRLIGNGCIHSPAKSYNIFYMPVGMQRMHLSKGNYGLLFFIPPRYYLDNLASEYSQMNDILFRLMEQKYEGKFLSSLSLPNSIWRLLKKMEKSTKKGTLLDIELRKFMYEVIVAYTRQLNDSARMELSAQSPNGKALAVKQYIMDNLSDPNLGGVQQLAENFFTTPKPLTKEFRVITKKTIPQFISDERLAWAVRILATKKVPVFEIAFMVGFSDTSNFIRKFKKKFGHSPTKY